ncbi:hypothetical protein KP509_28G011000 [Ceratopteris richardii]|uniref:Uncharacterized protein n=1 Tax=Ceratopteris richardii TaxID=49495 RepID=A0A8T2RAQ3_CERRI|nr:hypothetical protein KP509_28G011000 [Ceratopteris richardii]
MFLALHQFHNCTRSISCSCKIFPTEMASTSLVRMTPIADRLTEVRQIVAEYEAGSLEESSRQQGDAPQETSLQQGGAASPQRGAAFCRCSKFPIWLQYVLCFLAIILLILGIVLVIFFDKLVY